MHLKPIGQIVKDARKAKGLSQLELAKYAGICRYSIIVLEQKDKTPKYDKMIKILEKLHIKRVVDSQFRSAS